MKNTYTLLNCEGDILVIYFSKNKITAQALLDDGSGKISFEIQKFEIIKYLHSDITIDDLIQKSSIVDVELYDYKTKLRSTIDKNLIGQLACGNSLYNNLPFELKMSFPKRIELAVRANYLALDFKKAMEMVKNYFYLQEKLQLLSLTFGDNNATTKKCKKQFVDLRHNLLEFEIPIEFANYNEIQNLGIKQVCLEKECNLDLIKIVKKDIDKVTNKEMNYLVYRLSDLIADLNKNPRFWNKKAKNKYIQEYSDHYFPFKRNIVIDDVLK